ERVVSYSLRLGREYGLNREQMKALEFGSLLHDIGKIGVPDLILRKPAKLTEEEWVVMREHPMHGQQILRGIEFLQGASRVVAQHHEKWDGSGYPLGLIQEEIDVTRASSPLRMPSTQSRAIEFTDVVRHMKQQPRS